MKLFDMSLDENGRSTVGFIEVPMQKISETEFMSAKQDAIEWRIGFRNVYGHQRTSPDYVAAGGPFEMHVGGPPHFIGWMAGNNENTMQDGSVFRLAAGDFLYVRPGALHHSTQLSQVPPVVFNLLLPGTDEDIGPLVIK